MNKSSANPLPLSVLCSSVHESRRGSEAPGLPQGLKLNSHRGNEEDAHPEKTADDGEDYDCGDGDDDAILKRNGTCQLGRIAG